MKIKKVLIIFFLGLIMGVVISPFASGKPENFFVSPVSLSMAETQDLLVPGVEVEDEILRPAEVTFSDLIEPPKATQKDENPELLKSNNEVTALSLSKQKEVVSTEKGSLTVAILGDSMVDTMGEGLPYLEKVLKKYYPNYNFHLLNYGVGSNNIEDGIHRLTQSYDYLGKTVPALVASSPDIVIVESFAYNPWDGEQSDLDRHWLAMANMVDILKTQTKAKIIFMATFAPNKSSFGAGPNGVNWAKDLAWQHAEKINLYLINTLKFATSQNIPVVDAYHPSLVNGDGNLTYINASDYIHPSVAGCTFVADLIAQKLIKLGWIK